MLKKYIVTLNINTSEYKKKLQNVRKHLEQLDPRSIAIKIE